MFKGDCLSLNINNSNAFLSRYVMLCHAFRQVYQLVFTGNSIRDRKLFSRFPVNSMMGKDYDFILPIVV